MHKVQVRDVTCIAAQVFNKDHWSGPALFVILNAILNGLNNLDNISTTCVMGTRSSACAIQKYLSGVGEGVGSPLQMRKVGIFYISCLVERSVPVFLWKPTALVIFELILQGGGGGCSINCRGVVSVQYSYGKL